jgi:UDP-glucose 4-epimerase
MKKKIVITGIAGFIGSKLAKKLIIKGFKIIGIDNLSSGYKNNIPIKSNFYKIDCSNKYELKKINFKNVYAIYHIGGQSGGAISFDDPIIDMKYNVESTLNLLEICVNNNIKNFFYASSVAVYGNNKKNFKVNEKNICKPLSFYGLGKITSENYINLYKNYYGLNACSLRIFNTYGPGQDLSNLRQGMLSIYLSYALKFKKIVINGSLNRYRDFVHVDDVVKAFILLLNYKKHENCYNVCYGKKTTVKTALNIIKENLPFDISFQISKKTIGDQFGIVGSSKLIKKKLNWQPKFANVKHGIKNFVKSYL